MEKIILSLIVLACLALLLMSYAPGEQVISGLPNYRSIPTDIIKTGGNNAEGKTCVTHATCGPGFYCSKKGLCLKTGGLPEGAECDATEDCEAGLICNNMGFCEKQKTIYATPLARKEVRYEPVPKMPPAKTPELKEKIDQLEKELDSFTQEHKKRIQELRDLLQN